MSDPYRLRTRIRRHLPWFLINLGVCRKGNDCEKAGGLHEWHNKDGRHSACYHCNVIREGRLWERSRTGAAVTIIDPPLSSQEQQVEGTAAQSAGTPQQELQTPSPHREAGLDVMRIRAHPMKDTTWEAIDSQHRKFPQTRASGVTQTEIRAASDRLNIPFPPDYSEFLERCGGGSVGSYSIAGLRRWEFASIHDWNVVEQTELFRQQRYPGAERWVIFTGDGWGNPIGLDAEGRIWLSDHDSAEFVGLEPSFEAWLRSHALDLDAPSNGYFAQEPWPEEILDELRAGASKRRGALLLFLPNLNCSPSIRSRWPKNRPERHDQTNTKFSVLSGML